MTATSQAEQAKPNLNTASRTTERKRHMRNSSRQLNKEDEEESWSLLNNQNGNQNGNHNGNHNNVAHAQPKKKYIHQILNLPPLHKFVYICGLILFLSKTKSRCTPPKAFEVEHYEMPPGAAEIMASDDAATRIPKIIHQSYKSLETLPKEWADTPSRWKKLHPSYEYKFWSDDDNRNLIKNHYPWFLETYDSYPAPISRADAARYFAVMHYGGIYADMDVLPIRTVDPLLYKLNLPENDYKEMIIAETYNLGLTNALFASVPNSTVLDQFTKELPFHTKPLHGLEPLFPHFAVLLSAGPTLFWTYLYRNGLRSKVIPLNPAGWGQCHICRPDYCKTQEGAFFETLQGGSWHKWDTKMFNFMFCHVHFCLWGGLCALIWFYTKCLAKRFASSAHYSGGDLNGVELVQSRDAEKGLQGQHSNREHTRRWNTTNMFGSSEGFISLIKCMMQVLATKHRLLMFCGVILLLLM
uniref:Alpha 1,4-glycosyltransferase domain-containing protein n=2 Tax=Ditylum brightwellii TaxID=49249 RepID=A0A7S1ZRA7_9STRA|mmetsp:Transcript_3670/g.5682  ORF Transcript_3670/g.5682 Transcript_3670/m.5682 type:complete len:469 (+) Transcript_3670:100-1506(+)